MTPIHRHSHLRPVLRDEHVLDESQLAARTLEQAGQVQLLLIDLQLQAVDVLGDRLQSLPEGTLVAAQHRELLVLAGALGLCAGQPYTRLRDRTVHRVEHGRQRLDHKGRSVNLAPADDRPPRSLLRCRTLGLQLAGERLTPRLLGTNAFLRRLHPEARLDLCVARGLEFGVQGVACTHIEDRTWASARRLELGFRLVRRGLRIRHPLPGQPESDTEPIEFCLRGLELHFKPVQVLRLRGQLRVELAQGRERRGRLLLRHLQHAALLGECELRPVDERRHFAEPLMRRVAVRNEFDTALLRARTTAEHEIGEHFAPAGDDRHRSAELALRESGRGRPGRVEIVGDGGERQQPEHATRRFDHGTGGNDPVDPGQIDIGCARGRDDDLHPPEVVGGCVGDRLERCLAILGEHGIRQRTESRGNGRLEPRAHPDVLCDQSAHTRQARIHESGGTVLLVERERQCAGARIEGVPLTFEYVEFLAEPLDLALGLEDVGLGELIGLVEVALVRIRDRGIRLARRELGARLLLAVGGRVECVLLAEHFAAHRGKP